MVAKWNCGCDAMSVGSEYDLYDAYFHRMVGPLFDFGSGVDEGLHSSCVNVRSIMKGASGMERCR